MLYTAPPKDFEELVERLRKIKDLGYIATHRVGATGIGKTLEDLLGIEENNVPGPNTKLLELKSTRKGSKNMITLITKSPSPEGSNSLLLRQYGYSSPSRKGLVLHVTLRKPGEITFVRGKPILMLRTTEDKIEIVSTSNEVLAYWEAETLRVKFEEKFPALILVKADVRGRGSSEEFWYNEAWLLKGFLAP